MIVTWFNRCGNWSAAAIDLDLGVDLTDLDLQ